MNKLKLKWETEETPTILVDGIKQTIKVADKSTQITLEAGTRQIVLKYKDYDIKDTVVVQPSSIDYINSYFEDDGYFKVKSFSEAGVVLEHNDVSGDGPSPTEAWIFLLDGTSYFRVYDQIHLETLDVKQLNKIEARLSDGTVVGTKYFGADVSPLTDNDKNGYFEMTDFNSVFVEYHLKISDEAATFKIHYTDGTIASGTSGEFGNHATMEKTSNHSGWFFAHYDIIKFEAYDLAGNLLDTYTNTFPVSDSRYFNLQDLDSSPLFYNPDQVQPPLNLYRGYNNKAIMMSNMIKVSPEIHSIRFKGWNKAKTFLTHDATHYYGTDSIYSSYKMRLSWTVAPVPSYNVGWNSGDLQPADKSFYSFEILNTYFDHPVMMFDFKEYDIDRK